MKITISTKTSRDETKTWYYFEKGKGKGDRWASQIFTYTKPANALEKLFNKNQLTLLEEKRMRLMLGEHKIAKKTDFLAFYHSFVIESYTPGKRHLPSSYREFKAYCEAKKVDPDRITEDHCVSFRRWLLDKFHGETPLNYFTCFKKVVKAATKAGYFQVNVAEDIKAKKNPGKERDFLMPDEFKHLLNFPCSNDEVRRAFLFSMLTGLAFVDVKALKVENIKEDVLSIYRAKSKILARVPLHPIALSLIVPKTGLAFLLPSANGTNKIIKKWVKDAGINKHITYHCGRHGFSIDLLRKGTDMSTVAGMMGHTSTAQVSKVYRRYLDIDGADAVKKLYE